MKKHIICWLDVVLGFLAASVFWLFIYAVAVRPNAIVVSDDNVNKGMQPQNPTQSMVGDSEVVEETVKQYVTNMTEAIFRWEDGSQLSMHAPAGFYSLTDQYIDELEDYYKISGVSSDKIYVVGDADATNACTVMINSAALSSADILLSRVYGDDYDQNEDLQSEVLRYMQTGHITEDLPDNYYLLDLGTVEADGITQHIFYRYYTISYTYYNDDDVAETDPQELVIPNYDMVAYSSTDDIVETVLYMVNFDVETAYNYMCEFFGTDGNFSDGTVVTGTAPVVEEVE